MLGKPYTVFTSIGGRKYVDIFTAIDILFSVKISQNTRLFSSCVMHMQRFESLQGKLIRMLKGPNKKRDIVEVRDSGYSR